MNCWLIILGPEGAGKSWRVWVRTFGNELALSLVVARTGLKVRRDSFTSGVFLCLDLPFWTSLWTPWAPGSASPGASTLHTTRCWHLTFSPPWAASPAQHSPRQGHRQPGWLECLSCSWWKSCLSCFVSTVLLLPYLVFFVFTQTSISKV